MKTKPLLFLSKADITNVALDMGTVLELVERAFLEKSAGNVEMPAKIGIHPVQDAFLHAMPSFISGLNVAGVKWISSYQTNISLGLPNIQGLIVLNDPATGIPISVMDCTWITAYRTGAATALSARYLACPESRIVGVLACGVQGRTNLEALALMFSLERVYAYDVSPSAKEQYLTEMSTLLGIEVIGVETARQAVEGCDLVITSGPIQRKAKPVIEAGWLKPGGFGSSVDFGSYWTHASLMEMDRLATDDISQFQAYREIGYFDHVPDPYTDLAELVAGRIQGRHSENERTIAINLGLALEDIAVASEVFRRAINMGVGTWLEL